MSRKPYVVVDLLCGAGGSSTGAVRAFQRLGLPMSLRCLNHWPVAIETHILNHPEAAHYCQDIATARPSVVAPEGYVDLLMASPTCTFHSIARGGKPVSDQQRSDPWHIVTWLTELWVKRMIIENVWEFVKWGPVDPRTGKPIREREGEYFRAWIDTIRRLGATGLEYRKLNSADYGGATTRQRFFGFFRFDRKPLLWPVATHGKSPKEGDGLQQWTPARAIIDWSIRGKSIFSRKVPLAPKTLARILAGAQKFGWPDVLIEMLVMEMGRSLAHAIGHGFARRHGPKAAARQRARVRTYIAWLRQLRGASFAPGETVSCGPMLITLRRNADGRSIEQPVPALAANGKHVALAEPVIVTVAHGNNAGELRADERRAHSVDEPLGGKFGVAEPFILNRHGADGGQDRARSLHDPAPTITNAGGGYVIEPFLLSRHGDGAPRSTQQPTPTQVAKHSHILIAPYYGSGSGQTCHSAEQPLPAATAKARFGMVLPVTHSDRSNRARDVEHDPLPTLTTARRGELAFITAQFGERDGQAPRVHDIGRPAPAICATGHVNLVEATGYDVLFRMLEDHELAAAMGFRGEGRAYRFAGTKTDRIKQIGNAVQVDQMEANVYAMMRDEIDGVEELLEAAE